MGHLFNGAFVQIDAAHFSYFNAEKFNAEI